MDRITVEETFSLFASFFQKPSPQKILSLRLTWKRKPGHWLKPFLEGKNIKLENLMFRRPNLEDVFIERTGKGLRD